MSRSKKMNAGHLLSQLAAGRKAGRRRYETVANAVESLEERQLFSAYYVNAAATVNGAGTSGSPWNSLYAIDTHTGFQSGDVVKLSGTFTNQILFMGNALNGVTLTSADPNNPATISESSSYGFANAIQVTTFGVTISYLNLVGPGITSNNNSFFGILFNNTGSTQFVGATVDHVNESGFVFAGLMIEGTTKGFTNASVTNSSFSNNQVSGIVVQGPSTSYIHTNLLISNCVASGNAGAAVYYNANNSGASEDGNNGGIFLGSVSGADVTHCTAIGNCYNSRGACGIWAHDCDKIIFEYSESADNRTNYPGFDGNGFDFDNNVSDSLMQYDYSHGNDGVGLYLCSFGGSQNDNNDTIRYSITDDDGRHGNIGVMLYAIQGCYVTSANIYNNTILAAGGSEEGFTIAGPGASGCSVNFVNNIIYTVAGAAAVDFGSYFPSTSDVKLEGNDYWVTGYDSGTFKLFWGTITYTSVGGFASGTGEETINGTMVGLSVDPLLVKEAVSDLPIANVSNLALSAGSPLWGAGLLLTGSPFSNTAPYSNDAPYNLAGSQWNGIGTQDYFANPLNQSASHDIGAGGQVTSMTINGTAGGNTFTIKADASSSNTVDINGTAYKGIASVVINGSTGNEVVTVDYANGPIGVTFNGGTAANTLTVLNSGDGSAGTNPISFLPAGASNNLNISAGTVLVPASTLAGIRTATFSNITISSGAEVAFARSTSQGNRTLVVVTGGLTFSGTTNAWTGTLDLGGNDLDVKNGNLTNVANQVHQGWINNWQAIGGIVSTSAATDTTRLTTLGVIRNSVDGSTTGAVLHSAFDSIAAASSDILVKYTYFGDADLSGDVDASDYSRIDNGFVNHLTGWYNGDLNYDGVVNGSDYTLIDNTFNTQGAALTADIAFPAKLVSDTASNFVPANPNVANADDFNSDLTLKKKKLQRSTSSLFASSN